MNRLTAVTSGCNRPADALDVLTEELVRPRTRGECIPGVGVRPCPWASCRHHLAAELIRSGALGEDDELPEGAPTCSLDLADASGATLEDIATLAGLTRERIRQIEREALHGFIHRAVKAGIIDKPAPGWWWRRSYRKGEGKTAAESAIVSFADPAAELSDREQDEIISSCFVEDDDDAPRTTTHAWVRFDRRVVSPLDLDEAAALELVERIHARALEARRARTEDPGAATDAPKEGT